VREKSLFDGLYKDSKGAKNLRKRFKGTKKERGDPRAIELRAHRNTEGEGTKRRGGEPMVGVGKKLLAQSGKCGESPRTWRVANHAIKKGQGTKREAIGGGGGGGGGGVENEVNEKRTFKGEEKKTGQRINTILQQCASLDGADIKKKRKGRYQRHLTRRSVPVKLSRGEKKSGNREKG